MQRVARVCATVCAIVIVSFAPTAAQTPVSYNLLGFPLPPPFKVSTATNSAYATAVAFDQSLPAPVPRPTPYLNPTVLGQGDHPALDCAGFSAEDTPYEALDPSPDAGAYVRITFGNSVPTQRVRFRVASGAADEGPRVDIATAGWTDDSFALQWPGGDLQYSLQYCNNYAFEWFTHAPLDFSAMSNATPAAGSVQISSGGALAHIEWGPAARPLTMPKDHAHLVVGYEKTCPELQLASASKAPASAGLVATNYAFAKVVADNGTTPVIVPKLSVEIVYDPPLGQSNLLKPATVTAQSSVATSEQMRTLDYGSTAIGSPPVLPGSPICRGFKVSATATPPGGGKPITAEIKTP